MLNAEFTTSRSRTNRRAADPDRSWVALGSFSRIQKRDHAHRQALGVLMKKMPVPRFQFYFFSPKLCFCFCELLWFWKWRRFLNFYPMKTLLSRNSEVKSQVGYSQIRNELIEASPTSHRNLCFEVANSEVRLRAQSSLSGSAARRCLPFCMGSLHNVQRPLAKG